MLALLCLITAAGAGLLLWQRLNPSHVDTSVLTAARGGVEALYAYDYQDSEGSVERKLAVLTGELREQYEADLSQAGILDTYEQVSATTSYEVVDVGLQQINEAQDTATLVVFGRYVVKSATSDQRPATSDQRPGAGAGGLGVRGEPRRRPVLHADGAGRRGPHRRRLEDQRAHAAHHQLIATARRGVAVPPEADGWHHGRRTYLAPVLARSPVPGMWRRSHRPPRRGQRP